MNTKLTLTLLAVVAGMGTLQAAGRLQRIMGHITPSVPVPQTLVKPTSDSETQPKTDYRNIPVVLSAEDVIALFSGEPLFEGNVKTREGINSQYVGRVAFFRRQTPETQKAIMAAWRVHEDRRKLKRDPYIPTQIEALYWSPKKLKDLVSQRAMVDEIDRHDAKEDNEALEALSSLHRKVKATE